MSWAWSNRRANCSRTKCGAWAWNWACRARWSAAPVPGPGLGVRILGEVKAEYAEILGHADHILSRASPFTA
jgi:hypothetical protein